MQQLPFWRREQMLLKNGKVPWMLFILSKPCTNSSIVAWQGPGQLKSQIGKLRSGMLWLTQVTHSLSRDENLCLLALKFWNMLAPRSKIVSMWHAWGTPHFNNKSCRQKQSKQFCNLSVLGVLHQGHPQHPTCCSQLAVVKILASVCFGSYRGSL